MTRWPKDTQAARNAFYGDPGKGQIEAQMVPIIPPFAMYYEGKRVKSIKFHRLAAPSLLAALNEIWDYCERDQKKIDASGVSKYNGAYNRRYVRGSTTKWSNHAYATAIDLNAGANALGVKKGTMPEFVVDAFCRQGAMWGGWYKSRPDWMHFEFVDNGGRKPKSARPVWPPRMAALLDMPDDPPRVTDELEEAPVETGAPSSSIAAEVVQRRLERMGYFPGVIGTPPGGMTAGAVAGFKNDRGLSGEPVIDDALVAELDRAEAQGFKRPIATARAEATEATIAPKVEAIRQNWFSRLWAKILAIPGMIFAAAAGVWDQLPEAKSYIEPAKDFITDMPGWVWFAAVGGIGLYLWHSTRRTGAAVLKDFQEGRRL